MFEGDVSKRNLKEFTIASQKTKHIVIRSSILARLKRRAFAMDKLAHEDHTYCPLHEEFDRYLTNWYVTLNKSGRNAPMKLRSDFRQALTNMHRLHRESGEERPEPIHLYQYQR